MFEFNSINNYELKLNEKKKKVRFKFHEFFWVQMSLQLMLILSCDNNSLTIAKWPSFAAKINGVQLNVRLSIPSMIMNLNSIKKKVRFKFHEFFGVQKSLQLMLIFSCDNNFLTISKRPIDAAQINSVLLKIWLQFYKWLWI